MNIKTTAAQYLTEKGIEYRESGKEIITHCLFNDCDVNSKGKEAHLYFSTETGQYECKKCGEKGNLVTLAKYFRDNPKDYGFYSEDRSTGFIKKKETKKDSPSKNAILSNEFIEKFHVALPERIRLYLNKRGIPDNIIDQFKLGWGDFYGRSWITIPVTNSEGKFTLLKLRKDPNDSNDTSKMMVYPKGAQHEIYGWEMLKGQVSDLVICEGEFDRLVLITNGISAVTGTGGAGTFKNEWIKPFTKAENIYVCFDNDDAGKNGAKDLLGKLLEIDCENVFNIDFPNMGDGLKDVTDYFVSCGGNPDTFIKLARRVTKKEIDNRIALIERPYKPTIFEEWKEIISFNFPELVFPAEICLSIISQILIHEITNPFALVLVGVPSGGKTICINFFDAIDELTYATDKFTPASFVSNASNVKKEKLAEIDLLPRIKHKAFLIRDLATLFSKRDDDLNECLGILTRVLDGEGLATDTGIHGRRNLSGSYLFMLIAASTPLPTRIWKMMGSLGSRLFFFSMQTREKEVGELVAQLKNTAFKEKERACRNTTRNFLYTLWNSHKEGIVWDRDFDPNEIVTVIARCAKLLAKLRGVISVWKERKHDDGEVDFDYTPPVIENPDRISMLFYNLCRGHAVATGRKQINKDDLKLIVELAIDSAPTTRAHLFRELIDHGGKMTTFQVEKQLDCSKPTALKEMKTLEALEVCKTINFNSGKAGQPESQLELETDFVWFLSDECRQIRGIEGEAKKDILSDLLD